MPLYVNDKFIDSAIKAIGQAQPVRTTPTATARAILMNVACEFERRRKAKDPNAAKVVEPFEDRQERKA